MKNVLMLLFVVLGVSSFAQTRPKVKGTSIFTIKKAEWGVANGQKIDVTEIVKRQAVEANPFVVNTNFFGDNPAKVNNARRQLVVDFVDQTTKKALRGVCWEGDSFKWPSNKFSHVSKNTSTNRVKSSTRGRNVPYKVKVGDLVRTVTYSETKETMFDFNDGSIYVMFNPDNAVWKKLLGQHLHVYYTSISGQIQDGDYYTLNAQQSLPNSSIDLTWDIYRLVNGKQTSVGTISAYTIAGLAWPE